MISFSFWNKPFEAAEKILNSKSKTKE